MSAVQITADEAIAAARAAAFTTDEGRTIVHTFRGPFGADWDLAGVEDFLRHADDIAWRPSIFGHDLVAASSDDVVSFDVKAPDGAA